MSSLVAQLVKNLTDNSGNTRDAGLIPELGTFPGAGNGNPFQYYCQEKAQGQSSLADYSPWGCKELDMTEATEHACTLCYNCLYFLYQGFPGSSAGK